MPTHWRYTTMATRKKTDPTEAAGPRKATSSHNGGEVKKTRAPRRKAAVERIPEAVTVDFHGVREQLLQSTRSAREAEEQARGAREEAAQLRQRIEEAARRAESE